MFHLQFENKQESHWLSSGAEQGLPTGDHWVFPPVPWLNKAMFPSSSASFPKVPSVLSTLQSTQPLVQECPQSSALVALVLGTAGTDHLHFCSHIINMQPANLTPSPASFPWTSLNTLQALSWLISSHQQEPPSPGFYFLTKVEQLSNFRDQGLGFLKQYPQTKDILG